PSTLAPPAGQLLNSLFGDDAYFPSQPRTLAEVGVSPVLIEEIACRYLLQVGTASGRDMAKRLCLPFPILEELLTQLRVRQIVVHTGQGHLNDYTYRLTDQGADRARASMQGCSYVGPVPVP